jgi:hypothetical protein
MRLLIELATRWLERAGLIPGPTRDRRERLVGIAVLATAAMLACIVAAFGQVPTNGQIDVLSQQSSGDYTAILNADLATGQVVYLPAGGSPYAISGMGITLPANAHLLCDPGVVISTAGMPNVANDPYYGVNVTGGNVTIDGCRIDDATTFAYPFGGPMPVTPTDRPNPIVIAASHFVWDGHGTGGTSNTGSVTILSVADSTTIRNTRHTTGWGHGVKVSGATNTFLSGIECESNAGFCAYLYNGASGGRIDGMWALDNTIELVGADHTTSHFTLANDRMYGGGDNCFSITGQYFTLSNIVAENCAYSGVEFYGSHNTLSGLTAINDGQARNAASKYYGRQSGTGTNAYFGVIMAAYATSLSHGNTVSGAMLFDTQATKTMSGMAFASAGAAPPGWTAATAEQAGAVVVNTPSGPASVYYTMVAQNAGTTGSTLPVCTVVAGSTCADGTVTWKIEMVGSAATRESAGNVFAASRIDGVITDYQDSTTLHANVLHTEWSDVLWVPPTQAVTPSVVPNNASTDETVLGTWTVGVAETYGEIVYSAAAQRLYAVTTPCTPAAGGAPTSTQSNPPVATADGCAYAYIGASNLLPVLAYDNNGAVLTAKLRIRPVESPVGGANTVSLLAGQGLPSGKAVEHTGSLYLDNANGGAWLAQGNGASWAQLMQANAGNVIAPPGGAPTVLSGFNPGAAIAAGSTNTRGSISIGNGIATTGSILFASARWASPPFCVAGTASATYGAGAVTNTSTLTLNFPPGLAGGTITWQCWQ